MNIPQTAIDTAVEAVDAIDPENQVRNAHVKAALEAALPHLPGSCRSHSRNPGMVRQSQALVELSKWIDAGNSHRDGEAATWGRVAKVAEEVGEVTAAMIGWTAQNPRKGETHTRDDVIEELLDVAVTALAAIEHLTAHRGEALDLLGDKILTVTNRAGVLPAHDQT